jgi:hypothetical protein
MKELRRLRGATADPFEQRVLRSWQEERPSALRREKTWSALAAGLGAGVAASAAAATASAAAVPGVAGVTGAAGVAGAGGAAATGTAVAKGMPWIAGAGVKWLVTGVVVSAAVGATTVTVVHSRSARPAQMAGIAREPTAALPPAAPLARPTSPVATGASTVTAPSTTSPLADSPWSAEAQPRAVHPAAPALPRADRSVETPPTAPTVDEHLIGEQVVYLDGARDALTGGDAARALRLLDEYDTRFPDGALAQEATVMRVRALLVSGDRDHAFAVGRRFVEGHPASPYATQVKQLLGNPR